MILIPRPSVLLLPPVAMEGGEHMNDINRTGYIDAITKLLQKADLRKLRLIWVYVERMTRTN